MGIAIHFGGTFSTRHTMKEFVTEVQDIATVLKWKFHVISDEEIPTTVGPIEKDCDLYGICLTPTECETMTLTFHSNRKMMSISTLQVLEPELWAEHPTWLYTISCKTQFGGPKMHKSVIMLLKYLSTKYLDDFTMFDETDYWNTGDEEAMTKLFEKMSSLINMLRGTIEDFPMQDNEDPEQYFKRILGDKVEIHGPFTAKNDNSETSKD